MNASQRTLLSPALFHWAAIGWTIIMAVGCFWPSQGLPDPSTYNDKYLHILIFLAFGAAWRAAGWPIGRVLLAGLLYGGFIEIVQALVPAIHRDGDWLDFAADTVGVVIGVGIGQFVVRMTRQK